MGAEKHVFMVGYASFALAPWVYAMLGAFANYV